MVTNALKQDARRQLRSNGFGLELQFTETQAVPLYSHRDLGGGRKRGDIVAKAHVQNPRHLNEYEAVYFSKKAAGGLFPWPPEECMSHTFENMRLESNDGGGERYVREKPYQGCKWCRQVAASGLGAEVSEVHEANAFQADEKPPLVHAEETPPLAKTDIRCEECGYIPASVSKSGKPLTEGQRRHGVTLHARSHSAHAGR